MHVTNRVVVHIKWYRSLEGFQLRDVVLSPRQQNHALRPFVPPHRIVLDICEAIIQKSPPSAQHAVHGFRFLRQGFSCSNRVYSCCCSCSLASFFCCFRSCLHERISAASAASCASLITARRSSLAARWASAAAQRSASVGTGGRSSTGTCAGAMMCLTTWRLFLDVRQPGQMATTSPVRRLSFGS